MKVLVGSHNPVKIEAVKEVFSKYFDNVDVLGIKVASSVPDQPINDETFDGAKNRALELKRINETKMLGAQFFVGIEGGIIKHYGKWFACGVICIIDTKGRTSFGTSPHFELPDVITKELLNRTELGDVMDRITGENNIKQKGGAIGFFTKEIMDRKALYISGLIVAFVPFLNEELYFKSK
jgi:inosine/xanthosine triphosphatase